MNILLLTSTFPANRADLVQHPFQLDLIDLLRREHHAVTVLTHAKGDRLEKVREDLDIIWFPWREIPGRLAEIELFRAGHLPALLSLLYNGIQYTNDLIRKKQIDLVICLWVIPSGVYVYINRLLRRTGVPYVLWALGSDINKYREHFLVRAVLKKVIRGSARVFADGLALCAAVTSLTGKDCEFLPSFRRLPIPSRPPLARTDEAITFLYVGRHTAVKGLDLLIDAIIQLEKTRPELRYRLSVVGGGELTPQLQRLVIENQLQHRVRFVGEVTDHQLLELYAQADCVVIPSRSESIPLVFGEALQCNKPMIVSDVGDMGELARKYRVARVVTGGNANLLAGALQEFIAQPLQIDAARREELLALLSLGNVARKLLAGVVHTGAR